MNLLKRSPPPPHPPPVAAPSQPPPPPHQPSQPAPPPPAPSQSTGGARLGSGEKSAFRAVERPSHQKPSAFRAISQLLATDNNEGPPRGGVPMDEDDDEDEEIQVQDDDSPRAAGAAWRERWAAAEQQPLELTKHDR